MGYDPNKLDLLSTLTGVYIMKDGEGVVLYVGKANNLRVRVKQYFAQGRDGRPMVPFLIAKVDAIETIIVTSEKEALLLENNLIKQHQPRYNALLKDDKTYIALKVTIKDKWPMIKLVRYRGVPENDGLYFGPYTSAYAARETLEILHRLFPLRQCSDQEFARRTRPCLLYQMKRCIGPCADKCSKEEYDHHLQRTIKFLKGQDKEVLRDLYEEMRLHSDHLDFEKANEILRTIRLIEKTIESQLVDKPLGEDIDVLGLHRHFDEWVIVKLIYRQGRLTGSVPFEFNHIAEEESELLSSFLLQHYTTNDNLPKEILLSVQLEDADAIEDLLQQRLNRKIHVHHPVRGDKKSLLEMAMTNAKAFFMGKRQESQMRERTLLEMQETLELIHYPGRIECFDNAHISGTEAVSSMVVYVEGVKDKKRYRTYRLKETAKADDYGAMYEVLSRRYKRAKEENDLPDLILVDGGKGQLNIALKVLEELNVIGVDVVSLAKEEGRHDKGMTEEKVYTPAKSDPIMLKKNSPVLHLLQQIRDEAHRVAITFHRKRRSKQTIRSTLDEIPGVGPAKRKALLIHFGSIKQINSATEDDLKQITQLTSKDRQVILNYFKGLPSN